MLLLLLLLLVLLLLLHAATGTWGSTERRRPWWPVVRSRASLGARPTGADATAAATAATLAAVADAASAANPWSKQEATGAFHVEFLDALGDRLLLLLNNYGIESCPRVCLSAD